MLPVIDCAMILCGISNFTNEACKTLSSSIKHTLNPSEHSVSIALHVHDLWCFLLDLDNLQLVFCFAYKVTDVGKCSA